MTLDEIKNLRDASFAKIATIFKDVTEGRWDNTHTAGQLRACVAMHEAATRQLDVMERRMEGFIDRDNILNSIELLKRYVGKKEHAFPVLQDVIARLQQYVGEGGAS